MRILFVIVLFLCAVLPLPASAGHHTSRTDELSAQLDNASDPVDGTILEEIAKVTYQVVADVPTEGLNNMQADLEGVIALRKKLETRPGTSEHLLTLTMQEGVDRSLVYEVYRKALHLQGRTYGIPFKAGSLDNAVLISLTEKNEFSELENIRYIVALEGSSIAKFCRDNNIEPAELLKNDLFHNKFPSDISDMITGLALHPFPLERNLTDEMMRDRLFERTLSMIDRARDVRTFFDIFLKGGGLPVERELMHDKLNNALKSPYRLGIGSSNGAQFVAHTIELYRGGSLSEDDYIYDLTVQFLPYLSNPEATVPAAILNDGRIKAFLHIKGLYLDIKLRTP